MLALSNNQRPITSTNEEDDNGDTEQIRDIYALTPPRPPPINRIRPRESWETSSQRSPSLSVASEGASSENFTTMSREFNALVIAGSAIRTNGGSENYSSNAAGNDLAMIGEDVPEESNPLAIVNNPLDDPVASPRRSSGGSGIAGDSVRVVGHEITVQSVKKEEVESKISAWQNAKIAKINNRFKREDAIINGWESEQVQKSTSWMKKVERKLEEKRAKALEKMENEVARARRKAEERKASAEAKRGTKVAGILEVANLMRAVGRAPVKRSFF